MLLKFLDIKNIDKKIKMLFALEMSLKKKQEVLVSKMFFAAEGNVNNLKEFNLTKILNLLKES